MTSTDDIDNMASTTASLTCRGSISAESSPAISPRSPRNVHGLDNRCKTCVCRAGLSGIRYVIPEASPAFRDTLGKMRSERVQNACVVSENTSTDNVTSTSTSSPSPSSSPSTSPTTSFLNKLKLAFKSTSTSSSHKCANNVGKSQNISSSAGKNGNSRRPASFGGADVVKPWTGRRASQYEKRVSWADERGSDKALYTVRLIKPRLSTESKRAKQITPSQSILRNSGVH